MARKAAVPTNSTKVVAAEPASADEFAHRSDPASNPDEMLEIALTDSPRPVPNVAGLSAMTDVIIGPSTSKRVDGGPGRATLAVRLTRLYRTEIAIAAAIVAILVTVSFWSPYVLTWGNLANIAQASAPLILMSLGVFLVIATSGIDLSVSTSPKPLDDAVY